jgi:hypothetical protein
MFFVFAVAVLVLAMIGLASVLGTSVAWIGALFLLPLIVLKVAFVLMMFGFIGRRMAGRRPSWDWDEPRWVGRSRPGRRRSEPSAPREERFEEWHRMAHAREEVDGWVADIDGSQQE